MTISSALNLLESSDVPADDSVFDLQHVSKDGCDL